MNKRNHSRRGFLKKAGLGVGLAVASAPLSVGTAHAADVACIWRFELKGRCGHRRTHGMITASHAGKLGRGHMISNTLATYAVHFMMRVVREVLHLLLMTWQASRIRILRILESI